MRRFCNSKKGYIQTAIVLYIFIFLWYIITSQGIDQKDIFVRSRQFLVPGIIIYIVQWIQQENLFSSLFYKSIIAYTGLLWGIGLPILKRLSNHTQYINTNYEILFGTYLSVFFLILAPLINTTKMKRYAWIVVSLILSVIPIADIVNVCIYGKLVDGTSFLAIEQTNFSVWWEWLVTYMGIQWMILIVFVILGFIYQINKRLSQHKPLLKISERREKALLLLAVGIFVYLYPLANKTWEISAYHSAKAYIAEQKQFLSKHEENYQNLQLNDANGTLAKRLPGTVILVIGESASRDHMKSYVPDYPYDDTPWLSEKTKDPNFIQFANVYSCYNQTAVALSDVLTEKSQYNTKEFSDSSTIIDVAKKAGYKTYWLTRQGMMGKDNTAMSLVGGTADVVKYVENPDGQATYDKDILPVLQQVVDKNASNFIVLHIMGSHSKYQWRYPESEAIFPADNPEGNYANTIRYTDEFLQEVFDYAQKNLNLQLMIYVSDHGENIYKGHNPQLTTFDQVRIPMFVYLSPEYQQVFNTKTKLLKSRQAAYFSNDMLYNTLSGMLNAESNDYDAKEDFSSDQYSFNRENVLSFLGKRHVSEDN